MIQSLLSALLFGLFPATGLVSADEEALARVEIAPPVEQVVLSERLSASGAVIFDLSSGQKIYSRNARMQRPMASLTKLMTALLIVENHDLDEIVVVPQGVTNVVGNVAYLRPGSRYRLGDVLSALLINSANDAALALAQYHSGSVQAFVTAMNERALELGMTGTSFRNPSGLDDPAQWSTPQDIAWLSMYALKYDAIADRLGRAGQRIVSAEGDAIQLYHTHALLHEVSPVMAGKTGTTNEAGQCLMSVVREGDRSFLVILLQSGQRYRDMQTIITALTGDDALASNGDL